ncbi:MAG: DUF2764 family protein [Victivallaceae bacterium]|nr:DUF2764 family protein [Victivallaceae bacterium]
MYYFLCASLPTPVFGVESRLTRAAFDRCCEAAMEPEDFAKLTSGRLAAPRSPDCASGQYGIYGEYAKFEQYLRTRIAERRLNGGDEKLPTPIEFYGEIDRGLAQLAQEPPAERERMIDLLRWKRLDELEAGHEFDLDKLCVLRLKFELLDKYRNRDAAAGRENFNAAVDRISGAAPGSETTSTSQEL